MNKASICCAATNCALLKHCLKQQPVLSMLLHSQQAGCTLRPHQPTLLVAEQGPCGHQPGASSGHHVDLRVAGTKWRHHVQHRLLLHMLDASRQSTGSQNLHSSPLMPMQQPWSDTSCCTGSSISQKHTMQICSRGTSSPTTPGRLTSHTGCCSCLNWWRRHRTSRRRRCSRDCREEAACQQQAARLLCNVGSRAARVWKKEGQQAICRTDDIRR